MKRVAIALSWLFVTVCFLYVMFAVARHQASRSFVLGLPFACALFAFYSASRRPLALVAILVNLLFAFALAYFLATTIAAYGWPSSPFWWFLTYVALLVACLLNVVALLPDTRSAAARG
jgi:hypothetical protein